MYSFYTSRPSDINPKVSVLPGDEGVVFDAGHGVGGVKVVVVDSVDRPLCQKEVS